MERKHIGFEMLIYPDRQALTEVDQALLAQAEQAARSAYAPYSRFRVGAAVRMDNGEVVLGSNQENASFPSGLCAERVAVFQAGARYPGVAIRCIAIHVSPEGAQDDEPAAPCGNCRQSIHEYEFRQQSPIRYLLQASGGRVFECPSTAALLPLGFGPNALL